MRSLCSSSFLGTAAVHAEDPYLFFTWNVTALISSVIVISPCVGQAAAADTLRLRHKEGNILSKSGVFLLNSGEVLEDGSEVDRGARPAFATASLVTAASRPAAAATAASSLLYRSSFRCPHLARARRAAAAVSQPADHPSPIETEQPLVLLLSQAPVAEPPCDDRRSPPNRRSPLLCIRSDRNRATHRLPLFSIVTLSLRAPVATIVAATSRPATSATASSSLHHCCSFHPLLGILCRSHRSLQFPASTYCRPLLPASASQSIVSPLGVPQQVILINGQFPGPNINSTTNNNIVVNVFNNLDEPFLLTWNDIQQRKNSWMDGVGVNNVASGPTRLGSGPNERGLCCMGSLRSGRRLGPTLPMIKLIDVEPGILLFVPVKGGVYIWCSRVDRGVGCHIGQPTSARVTSSLLPISDGMPSTNCPIPPGKNFTYHFQVKDQIGSFFYFPSMGMHRAVGAFGGLRINSHLLIPVPFADPTDDYTVLIGDWYAKSHKALVAILDAGHGVGNPAGVLINGRIGKDTAEAGKTYRYRICNVGMKVSLNFRMQKHRNEAVEMDGSHTVQNDYESLDGPRRAVPLRARHGQQEPKDYYMVLLHKFHQVHAKPSTGSSATPAPASHHHPSCRRRCRLGVVLSTSGPNVLGIFLGFLEIVEVADCGGSIGTGSLFPPGRNSALGRLVGDLRLRLLHKGVPVHVDQVLSGQQRREASSGAADVTRVLSSVGLVNGKRRFALNGVSHVESPTQLKLAEYYGIADKCYHLDGYSFPVGMGHGKWTPESRKAYNLLDAVSRHTIQVYPRSWSAIMLTFDNAGMWNLRSEMWERHYLGQQLYISVTLLERSLRDEYNIPDNMQLCGDVTDLPKPPSYV
ncbi:hypothetical protein C4D60_Mb09t04470 [Musa balbisiana]|uniref:Plastocyanin-like domain-containing protein n=1 Tax=Musa balbisiana TaxID=52838 RepID=A0A4S8IFB6_MUSBA|nr:hypothetical protein C4D60_Mb09t04470 [Musa balbisiana]